MGVFLGVFGAKKKKRRKGKKNKRTKTKQDETLKHFYFLMGRTREKKQDKWQDKRETKRKKKRKRPSFSFSLWTYTLRRSRTASNAKNGRESYTEKGKKTQPLRSLAPHPAPHSHC